MRQGALSSLFRGSLGCLHGGISASASTLARAVKSRKSGSDAVVRVLRSLARFAFAHGGVYAREPRPLANVKTDIPFPSIREIRQTHAPDYPGAIAGRSLLVTVAKAAPGRTVVVGRLLACGLLRCERIRRKRRQILWNKFIERGRRIFVVVIGKHFQRTPEQDQIAMHLFQPLLVGS